MRIIARCNPSSNESGRQSWLIFQTKRVFSKQQTQTGSPSVSPYFCPDTEPNLLGSTASSMHLEGRCSCFRTGSANFHLMFWLNNAPTACIVQAKSKFRENMTKNKDIRLGIPLYIGRTTALDGITWVTGPRLRLPGFMFSIDDILQIMSHSSSRWSHRSPTPVARERLTLLFAWGQVMNVTYMC